MRPGVPDFRVTDAQDVAELAARRTLAVQAVLGLIFGLLAPLALLDPSFWAAPLLGIVFSRWALRRIKRRAPAVVGRGMARTGLVLSLILAGAAPANWATYRHLVAGEAREFGDCWFRYLLQDAPQKAFQLTVAPQNRAALNERLWAVYLNDADLRQRLENYVGEPLVRTLLALGPRAQARFYQTRDQTRVDGIDVVWQLHAVTYEEKGERTSFFVSLRMGRTRVAGGGAGWQLLEIKGGVRPEGWKSVEDDERLLPRS
jgi:hypothetical protein